MARKKYRPKTFEGTGIANDTSANVYESMLKSAAFKDLTPRQRLLYVYCKAQFYGKRKPGKDFPDIEQLQGDDLFYFPMQAAVDYGLYTRNNHKNFYRDMKELERHGFIKTVINGKIHKTKSVYQYSGNWKFFQGSG